jgi:hypothetical protein
MQAMSLFRIVLGPCVILLSVAGAVPGADPASDAQSPVAVTLAVQDAMRQGREALQKGNAKIAVDLLEAQLPRINGNPAYLGLLREAYAAYVKQLQLEQKDDLVDVYQKRMQILDKPAATPPQTASAGDPLQQAPRRTARGERSILPEAEKAFAEKRYAEADDLYARAFGAAASVDPVHGPQWAYCKLFRAVARLKDAETNHSPVAAADLEKEVTAALSMAADDNKLLSFGRQVQEAIRQRAGERGRPVAIKVTVTHQPRGSDGWARAESANFRLMHKAPTEFAEQLMRVAEQARAAAIDKWSGVTKPDWKPACEIYLYATAAEYAKATGKAADSPGHATYKAQSGAIVGRRLDLRADDSSLLTGVVPHETTHLVLGDLFADAPLPRWADEGMAVLSEPPARIDRFNRTLHSSRRQGRLVPLDKVFAKGEYPDATLITVFYVESVSVVDFLVAEKGPQVFVQFVRDVTNSGVEAALQKHYDCRNLTALQDRWLTKTFAAADAHSNGTGAQ